MSEQTVNILGATYSIWYRQFGSKGNGETDYLSKSIYIRSDDNDGVDNFIAVQKEALKSEILKAFIYESGIPEQIEYNEVSTTWLNIQIDKILKVFKDLDLL